MVNNVVERATSDKLIGPDWAINIGICDICNHDATYAKDILRGIKKRLGSKNPKVQLLALTLLETIVKNCGNIVHTYVAEKDILHEMVRTVRKKPDYRVKEKILILIDTWQEAFGGPRARYPQYFSAYQELLRTGAVFPKRSEGSPVFTPPQSRPLASYPQNPCKQESRENAAESSAEAEFPTLSLTEIQSARGIMDVLAEMLNAIGPGNKEGLKQDVLVDLVEQCRTYKRRVVHLVNSTVDESLLCQGLALTDDLQRVLAKHEAVASRASIVEAQKPKSEDAQAILDAGSSLVDTRGSKQTDKGSASGTNLGTQLPRPDPQSANSPSTISTKACPKIDLLSGDYFSSPSAENSLVIEPQPASPASQQNSFALIDMSSQTSNPQSTYPVGQTYPLSPQFPQQQNLQSPESSLYPNGNASRTMSPQYEQSPYHQGSDALWNGHMTQQQQPASPAYGSQNNGAFPPPPWEAETIDSNYGSPHKPPTFQNNQFGGNPHALQIQNNQLGGSPRVLSVQNNHQGGSPHTLPMLNNQPGGCPPALPMQNNQLVAIQPQQFPVALLGRGSQPLGNDQVGGMYAPPLTGNHFTVNQSIQSSQVVGLSPQHQSMGIFSQQRPSAQMVYTYTQQTYTNQLSGYGCGFGQPQNSHQFLEQRMSGLNVRDDGILKGQGQGPPFLISTPSYVPPGKPLKPEDKHFGDLVDVSKFKP